MTSELAKNFIKSKCIKNFQQLIELMREFYYSPDNRKKEILDKYGSEDYKAFIWMQNKYVKGKIGKLKELFENTPAKKELVKKFINQLETNKEVTSNIAVIQDFTKEIMSQNIPRIPSYTPEELNKKYLSTRHKADPKNTNYNHVNYPLKDTMRIYYTDSLGNKKDYEYEQNSTSIPEFKSINDIFVTYFTPAEEEVIKEQEISNKDVCKATNQTRMASEVSGFTSKTELEELIEQFDEKRHNVLFNIKSKENKIAGKKESEGKLFYEFDWNFIEDCAKRMQTNKGKYERFNWKKSMDVEELKQSLFRHVMEIMKGNYKDGDDDYGHIYAGFCNLMLINWQLKNIDKNENSKNK